MNKTQKLHRDISALLARLGNYGITEDDALALRRIEMTLHRWHEGECGDGYGCIERDEITKKPHWLDSHTLRRTSIPDLEKGAGRRLLKIMARYPQLRAYIQGDPRGCALYLIRKDDIGLGENINSVYTRGIAVRI